MAHEDTLKVERFQVSKISQELLKLTNIRCERHKSRSGIEHVITCKENAFLTLDQTYMSCCMTRSFDHFEAVIPHFDNIAILHESDAIVIAFETTIALEQSLDIEEDLIISGALNTALNKKITCLTFIVGRKLAHIHSLRALIKAIFDIAIVIIMRVCDEHRCIFPSSACARKRFIEKFDTAHIVHAHIDKERLIARIDNGKFIDTICKIKIIDRIARMIDSRKIFMQKKICHMTYFRIDN